MPSTTLYKTEYNKQIKFSNKQQMNNQLLLQNLTDFRDLRSPPQKPQQKNYTSKSSNATSQHFSPEVQIELQNNDKLIKNFKELRQQLKQATRNCQQLKHQLIQKENDIERYRLTEKENVASIYQMKSEIQHLKHNNEEYKEKFLYLQQSAQQSSQQKQQLEYLKMLTYELRSKLEKVEQENKKIMELSVKQKVDLEQKIKKLSAKANSDLQYVQEMELQVSKLRQKNIKMENQLKKAEIKYDEQLYNKKWLNNNFEKQHLQQQMQELKKENGELLAKHKKEKEKRNNLEKKMLELEELTGLWTVKAETYEIQNKNYMKKFRKLEKKMGQTKQTADIQIQEALNWQERFLKAVAISEELIARIKRQLYGDAVNLAKSCEFKINKLKDEKDVYAKNNQPARKSPSISKLRSKSRPITNRQHIETVSPMKKPQNQNIIKLSGHKPQNLCRKLFTDNKTEQPPKYSKTDDWTSQSTGNKQNAPLSHIDNIQAKIRKQRQQMQKRIRQKMLYQKIEVTASSPEKHKLRQDYFRLIDR